MGIWGSSDNVKFGPASDAEIIRQAKAGRRAEQFKNLKAGIKKVPGKTVHGAVGLRRKGIDSRDAVMEESARAAAIAMHHQQPSFSREQEMLGEMFGQGEKIWGQNQEPVRLNNDLNPSRSDPYDETAGMFGAGRNGERSGLF